ncbi:uncharacterized protein BJ212DRAFT_120326 [Suillus subaureus]|uniref:C2H2-type domain-containing protein n=1 Tax=Suillus subaureus TaxID=48587 RepID=A0A9P7ED32_9AGAM|nr:uncharacterized protein BJ212DRAFT_120326 [Suillus subaureus]KAG1818011.1 hypothetical protein BJ212DRAFT_120326 [Suillus subaureus]
MSNEARSCTGDQPETSQDDPAEISVQNNTQQCHWIDETTHRKCLEFVPEEKDQKGCMWAVIHSGHESACGGISQRRNMPRHIAKHLGLRCTCKLCGKDFARSDLLKGHERKDHQVQDTSASYA